MVLSDTRSTWQFIINAVTMQTDGGKKHLHWRPCLMNMHRKGIVTVMQTTLSHSNPPKSNQSDPMQWWIYGVGHAPYWALFLSFLCNLWKNILQTRLHSSRMHTARMLTVYPSMLCTGGVYLVPGVSALGGSAPVGSAPGGMCVPGPGGSAPGGVCSGGVSAPGGVPGPRGVSVPSGGCLLLEGGVPAQALPPCEQNSWHMPMKILPCPKVRLWAVTIG